MGGRHESAAPSLTRDDGGKNVVLPFARPAITGRPLAGEGAGHTFRQPAFLPRFSATGCFKMTDNAKLRTWAGCPCHVEASGRGRQAEGLVRKIDAVVFNAAGFGVAGPAEVADAAERLG